MSGVQDLEGRLAELQAERDALLAARTSESTAESARLFLEAARRQSDRVGGHVVGVHAVGSALDDVLRAFLLSDPRPDSWLTAQAGEFAQLSERAKASQVKKLDEQIVKVTGERREAEEGAAVAEVRARFAGVAGSSEAAA